MDPLTHKRYLDYRERHAYFGQKKTMLTAKQFASADAEVRELEAKGDARDDEEEARFLDLLAVLLRD
jgi:hypothetical protein